MEKKKKKRGVGYIKSYLIQSNIDKNKTKDPDVLSNHFSFHICQNLVF